MSRSLLVVLICTCTLFGALGWAYGSYQVEQSIIAMQRDWGWVCGTGLYAPIYFLATFGAAFGFCLGWDVWHFVQKRRKQMQLG
jgi:hypothetical protein